MGYETGCHKNTVKKGEFCNKDKSRKKGLKRLDKNEKVWYYIQVAARRGHTRSKEKASKSEENAMHGSAGDLSKSERKGNPESSEC